MNVHSFIKSVFYKAGYSVKRIRSRPPRVNVQTGGKSDSSADLARLLHATNPYEGFDFRSYPFDLHGWGEASPAFRQLIAQTRPGLIVEVGTWKGASALAMAGIAREMGLSTQILCIDTWLGALEFWTDTNDRERYLSLQLRHGYPSVYYQFLANVCHQGHQNRIIPFPQAASIAALWLRYYGITADMIYLDASHEEEDVYQDLCNFWESVSSTGVLFGDDYHAWDGVRLAVDRFANEEQRQVGFIADKWVLRKGGNENIG